MSHKRSPAKRQAFKAAAKMAGVKVIVACEGEKVSMLKFLFLILDYKKRQAQRIVTLLDLIYLLNYLQNEKSIAS